jgi:hypothetical protein
MFVNNFNMLILKIKKFKKLFLYKKQLYLQQQSKNILAGRIGYRCDVWAHSLNVTFLLSD